MSKFGGPMSPRKPELRRPVLWLARSGNEMYLVNDSKETLELVAADCRGWLTVDDQSATKGSMPTYRYERVQAADAVKVEEYDGFYDLDYVLQVYLLIQSPGLGRLQIVSPPGKEGIEETVPLWDTGEPGKYVRIIKHQQPG